MRLAVLLVLLIAAVVAWQAPATWPSSKFELGRANEPWKVSEMEPNVLFRYQYLAGNPVNGGWQSWNTPEGAFADWYIGETLDSGRVPVFTYYVMLSTDPQNGEGQPEAQKLNNAQSMIDYFNNFVLLLQQCAKHASRQYPVIIHVEPDLWGNIENYARYLSSANPSPTVVPARINNIFTSGPTADALRNLPNNAAGFAQAFVALRNAYAPKVLLAYHLSTWGTGGDFSLETNPNVVSYGTIAANFYNALSARFDLTFGEFSDRDSGFYQIQVGANRWWTSTTFDNHITMMDTYSKLTGQAFAFWQIPFGNTLTAACDNTWEHYKDNRPELLLASDRTLLQRYINIGCLGLLFGAGASGCTYEATDGGYWKQRVAAYFAAGAMSLPGGGGVVTTTAPAATTTKSSTTVPSITTAMPSTTASSTTLSSGCATSGRTLFAESAMNPEFEYFGWGSFSFSTTTLRAHSGTKSAAFYPCNWNALYFHKNDISGSAVSVATYPKFDLWVYSTVANPTVQIQLIQGNTAVGNAVGVSTYVSSASSTWVKISLDVASAFGIPTSYDGFWLQDTSGLACPASAQPTIFVDDVIASPNCVTTPPATTTVKPTTTPPATTTAKPTTTAPVTTTAKPTTTAPATTTPKPTTTAPVTTTPKPTTTAPVTTTPKPTTTAPATTTPKPTTTAPATITPKPTTTAPVTTTAKPTTTPPTTTCATRNLFSETAASPEFVSWSWGSFVKPLDSTRAHTGTKSASMYPCGWNAIYFHKADTATSVSVSTYPKLTFWVYVASSIIPSIKIALIKGTATAGSPVLLSSYVTSGYAWRTVTIDVSTAFGVTDFYDGFWLQDGTGATCPSLASPRLFLDDVYASCGPVIRAEPAPSSSSKLSSAAIVGIVVGCVVAIAVIGALLFIVIRKKYSVNRFADEDAEYFVETDY